MTQLSAVAAATDIHAVRDGRDACQAADPAGFEALAEPIRDALVGRGFTDLTEVQRAVLASDAGDRDLQISSQTGSGKTVALGIVLAPRLLEAAAGGRGARALRALVIVPTRELAVQVAEELRWLYASVPGLSVECVTGGSSVGQERRRLESKPTVVVGTPGRMNDHIRRRAIDCRNVAEVVLDEADRMLDMGFREELEAILDETPSERATHLVSATFPPAIQKLARKYQSDPLGVQGTRLGDANQDIEHVGHLLRLHDRYDAIVNLLLLAKDERTLVFVNTRSQASALADQLVDDGFAAAPISGELEQYQRTRTLDAFRNGTTTVLVATDVAARGLDVPDVAMVIHTDAPMDAESYTHRAGRTGRAGRKGRSILFASPQRRRRVQGLLARANVSIEWQPVPTAAAVEKALAKQARRRLRDALRSAPEPTAKQLAHASALLEEMDPAGLVARLVELGRDDKRAAPREVDATTTSDADRHGSERRPAYRDRTASRERRGEAREPRNHERRAADRRPSGRDTRAATFEINWGSREGATPQRLLALLCRRGDVTGRMIGTIDIDHRTSTFEVSESVARRFEDSATMPDSRDPHLRIRRARAGRR